MSLHDLDLSVDFKNISSSKEIKKTGGVALKKEIGLLQGVSIIVGIIVGSGIFVSPVGVLKFSESVGLSLTLWFLTGLFSIVGALVYAELGVRIPKSGGEYAYILEAFGGLPAFVCMWITFVVIGGVACAANSLIFADYILRPIFPSCKIPDLANITVAIMALMLICAVNAYSVKLVTRIAVIFSIGKISALLIITGFGVYYLITGNRDSFKDPFLGSESNVAPLALAFYQGFWAFSGWNYLNFLTEEIANPSRNLPLAIIISLLLITGLYMLVNVSYLAVLSPFEILSTGEGSAAIAVVFARRVVPWMAWIMPVFVGASVFGSLNSEVMSLSRLTFTGAREGHMPSILAMICFRTLTPIPSILAVFFLSFMFQFYSDLFALIQLCGFAFSFVALMAVCSLLYLRWKQPNIKTSFTLPLVFPILFLLCDIFILGLTIYQQPQDSLTSLIIMAAAVPIYFLGVSWQNKPQAFMTFMHKLNIGVQKLFLALKTDEDELKRIDDA